MAFIHKQAFVPALLVQCYVCVCICTVVSKAHVTSFYNIHMSVNTNILKIYNYVESLLL